MRLGSAVIPLMLTLGLLPLVAQSSGTGPSMGSVHSVAARPAAGPVADAVLWYGGPRRGQAIHLGASTASLLELPPVPPAGAFDGRVLVDGVGTWSVPAGEASASYPLQLQGGADVLSWEIPPEQGGQWSLQVGTQRIDLAGTGSVELDGANTVLLQRHGVAPAAFALEANYPNPFNPSTTIRYRLPAEHYVVLSVYNLAGQRVREMVHTTQGAGLHAAEWDGTDATGALLANGVYLYELRAGEFSAVRKMVLMK